MKFRSDPSQIKGSIAPLMTPFLATGEVDHDSLANLVNWQLANGTHGISLGGSTGEPSSQSVQERADAIRTVAKTIDDRVPFMPGTGTEKLEETLELTAAAQDAGADAVLIITPYYARPTQEALYTWYTTVAREFPDLPIVAYNVPSRTAVDIAPETVARLYRDGSTGAAGVVDVEVDVGQKSVVCSDLAHGHMVGPVPERSGTLDAARTSW